MELSRYSFPKTARALTVAAAIGASALAAFPAAAQQQVSPTVASAAQTLPKDECRVANALIADMFTRYNGTISQQFVTSMKSFVASDCNMNTDFKMVEGTKDKAAFGEFRILMIANRMKPNQAKPIAFTQ